VTEAKGAVDKKVSTRFANLTDMGAGNCSFEEDTVAAAVVAGGIRAHRNKEGSRT
jgi:hypothetical protein